MSLKIDACIAQHQGDRAEQQDRVSLIAHPHGGGMALAVVADGMGGHTGGALAAGQVVHTAKNNFTHYSPLSGDVPEQLLQSVIDESHMLIKASRFINEKDPHSTAVMLLVQPGRMTWAHCGDSRLYRFRKEQKLSSTVDHSYVEQLIAQKRISKEAALMHPHRNILLTSLGGEDVPTVTFGDSVDLQGGDSFLLCSDGLWGYFDDEELGSVLANYSAREGANLLVERARQRARGKGDNLSLVILRLIDEVKPTSFKTQTSPSISGRRL